MKMTLNEAKKEMRTAGYKLIKEAAEMSPEEIAQKMAGYLDIDSDYFRHDSQYDNDLAYAYDADGFEIFVSKDGSKVCTENEVDIDNGPESPEDMATPVLEFLEQIKDAWATEDKESYFSEDLKEDEPDSLGEKLDLVFDKLTIDHDIPDWKVNEIIDAIDDNCPNWENMSVDEIVETIVEDLH